MLTRSTGSLLGSKIEVLHDLVFGNIVFTIVLVVFTAIGILLFDLPGKFLSSLFLKDFESSCETASFFIQKFGNLGCSEVLSLKAYLGSDLWDLSGRVKWSDSEPREGER